MLKKRLIFVLYYNAGAFHLSRNFRLQKVGSVHWLIEKFRFKSISQFIDEIIILDVTRGLKDPLLHNQLLNESISFLMKETFIPLTIGGGLSSLENVRRYFNMGADKVLINSAIIENSDFVKECVAIYGAQAVIGAIDLEREGEVYFSKVNQGQKKSLVLHEHLERIVDIGVGEILINSINNDGTGMGFDEKLIELCTAIKVPLIVAGGAGKPEHFAQALSSPLVQAVASGNLFNFIGKGFELVRHYLIEQNFPIRSL